MGRPFYKTPENKNKYVHPLHFIFFNLPFFMIRVERILIGIVFLILGKLINIPIDLESLKIITIMGIPVSIVACASVYFDMLRDKSLKKHKKSISTLTNIYAGHKATIVTGGKNAFKRGEDVSG